MCIRDRYQTDTLDDPEKLDFRRLNDYQLILLDVMMPGTDGFSLCRRIRDQVDCPILFVTAKTDEADLDVYKRQVMMFRKAVSCSPVLLTKFLKKQRNSKGGRL